MTPGYESSEVSAEKSLKRGFSSDVKGIILFLPLVLLTSSDSSIFTSNQILFMADLNFNIIVWGWLYGISLLSTGVFTFVFGYLTDKHPRKLLLILGGTVWTGALFIMVFSPNYIVLIIGRMLGTFGLGAMAPVTFSLLSDMFPSEKRSNSFAWWSLASLIGGLFGASLGLTFNKIPFESIPGWATMDDDAKMLYLKSNYGDLVGYWRLSYLLVAIIAVVFVILCLKVKEPKRGGKDYALKNILSNDEVKYTFAIKRQDLKFMITVRSNFWLIFNFLDVVVSGFFLSNILYYVNHDMQFDFVHVDSLGQLLLFIVPAILLGLFGQFYFAKKGDAKVKAGDPAGRVKVAILGGVLHIPFFIIAFLFTPNKALSTFFLGATTVPEWAFWVLVLVMGIILGIGLMWSFAIAPNWYASLIDVNLPEHRGTMIAAASFMDTIGRAVGAIVGSSLISFYMGRTAFPAAISIIWMTVIFGSISGLMWLPIYKYCNKDFVTVQKVLEERGKQIREQSGVKPD